jgi:hypothetical protein
VEIDFLSIDPGVHKSAVACWSGTYLVFGDDLPNPSVFDLMKSLPAARVLVETPVLYPTKRKQHKDVKRLLVVVDRIKAAAPVVSGVSPSGWKGQVPKKIHGVRIIAALTKEEISNVVSIANHNTIDAIGLGLWALGRLGRGGCRKGPKIRHLNAEK